MSLTLPAFSGYGIELEYMIVDRRTLSILPIAEKVLQRISETRASGLRCGELAWSHELVLHLIELKNVEPHNDIDALAAGFQSEIQRINDLLEPMVARLMPTAMHPWMNPRIETQIWQRENAEIYTAYDRIFDCNRHGWANLQSMQLNVPFANDHEFARLHAAVRLLLPILPALAASSPIVEGGDAGSMDFRMESYLTHQARVPLTMGKVIPDTSGSRAAYERDILAPMYREVGALDAKRILQQEWLNVRGAVPRFDRNAIEIRVIDTQECPQADLAIAAATTGILRTLYDEVNASLSEQQAIETDVLVEIMHACIRSAEEAVITNAEYLRLLGFPDRRCDAGELWRHLIGSIAWNQSEQREHAHLPLQVMLDHGPLARRIQRTVGPECSKKRLVEVYEKLCDCLEAGTMFLGLD
jgi:gamma-glutamyl:cysteine ligase YbdK (ATP-grasp superfamily)